MKAEAIDLTRKKTTEVLRENAAALLYIFSLNILLLIPSVLSPIFKKVFTDYILIEGNTEWLFTLLALMTGTALFSGIVTWMQKNCLTRLSDKIEISGISQYMWMLLNSPMSLFDKKDSFSLLSQSENSNSVSRALTRDVLSFLFNVVSVVFYFLMMLRIDIAMSMVVVALIAFNFTMSKIKDFLQDKLVVKDKNRPNYYDLITKDERICARGLMNIETFKSTASETFFFSRLVGSKMDIVNAKRDRDYEKAYEPLDDFPQIIFMNLLLLVSAFRIMNRSFSIGTYLAFQAYASALFLPFGNLLLANETFGSLGRSLKRVLGPLTEVSDDLSREIQSGASAGKLDGRIEFNNVTFGYDAGNPVIKDFSLSIKAGSKVAVLGESGAGKTTLLKLLQGLYKPDSGEITIDGINPAQIDKAQYLNSIGCANQEITLFSASIRDNISMWDKSISDAMVYKAASDACIHSFIASLDGAYDYALAENGKNFSGGQRQRLEIARALVYNPSVVLFDEALSSIDPVNRASIEDNIVKRGCTCISVTHILERLPKYDDIIILDNGIIAARGTHSQLLESSAYYASLYSREVARNELSAK